MKIIKRKGYYYLHYTYRKNKRISSKEHYLGKEIPDNLEKIKEDFLKTIKKDLYLKLESIKRNYFLEWKHFPSSVKEKMLKDLDVNFTYNTNAIEGSTITLEETEDLLKREISPNKPIRDIKETLNHSKVFLNMLNEKERMSEKLILKWHKEIFFETKKDIAGKYRDYFVKVGEYLCTDWQDIPKLMKDLIRFHHKNKLINAVELSARIHYKFEKIHPFGDGNGRLGRLISNFILYKYRFPLLIIDYKKRQSYYKALRRDEEDFVNYYLRRYLSCYNRLLTKNH